MPTFSLDDRQVEFAPGETIIQAAHRAGVDIPHYCWHPGLSTAANCRMCLVEIAPPPGRPQLMLDVVRLNEQGEYVSARKPKLQPACQQQPSDGMVVKSQTSEHVKEARSAVQELLLLNHPIDCPICDQAGECRLQDYWLEHSGKKKRMRDEILHRPKAVDFGPTIVYDAERCIVCTRCVRFCEEVVGDPVLDKRERGNLGEIVLAPGRQLDHAYTLMTEHVCPVGALTAKDFRFKARVWFLRSVPSVCQGCATGCSAYTDFDPRDQTVHRHRPRDNAAVNKYWMCDEGVLDYRRVHEGRLLEASIEGKSASVEEAVARAAELLAHASMGETALLLSYSHSSEDNYAVLELARSLGVTRHFATGRPDGAGDTILRHTDKNPNRAGVRALGGETLGELSALVAAIESGAVRTVLALGSSLELPEASAALAKTTLVSLSTHQGPLAAAAKVVLPASSWAEASGTFVNAKGMAQESSRAIAPRGASRPAWRLALALGARLEKPLPFGRAEDLRLAVQPQGVVQPSAAQPGAAAGAAPSSSTAGA
jgi:NADH-quinone oxidoreductase subunit G